MKSKLIYPTLAAIILMLSACEEKVDIDLDSSEPELVVEGYMIDTDFYIPEEGLNCYDSILPANDIRQVMDLINTIYPISRVESLADYFPFNKVRLTMSTAVFDEKEPMPVSGAEVQLLRNDSIVETLIEDASELGTYRITHDPLVGADYHLEILADGKSYSTEPETYLEVPPIILGSAVYQEAVFSDTMEYYSNIFTYEKPGRGDYYRWFFYLNNELLSDPEYITVLNDDGIDGACLPAFDFYRRGLELNDTLVIFQMRISEKYANFMTTLTTQASSGTPFDSPPAPLPSNVYNNTDERYALGYFALGGISANAVIVPDTIPAQ